MPSTISTPAVQLRCRSCSALPRERGDVVSELAIEYLCSRCLILGTNVERNPGVCIPIAVPRSHPVCGPSKSAQTPSGGYSSLRPNTGQPGRPPINRTPDERRALKRAQQRAWRARQKKKGV